MWVRMYSITFKKIIWYILYSEVCLYTYMYASTYVCMIVDSRKWFIIIAILLRLWEQEREVRQGVRPFAQVISFGPSQGPKNHTAKKWGDHVSWLHTPGCLSCTRKAGGFLCSRCGGWELELLVFLERMWCYLQEIQNPRMQQPQPPTGREKLWGGEAARGALHVFNHGERVRIGDGDFFYFPLRKESEFYLFQHSVLVGVLVDLVLPISL